MKTEDIKYLQNKLGELNEGKRHNWNLRDRALISELLIDWQQSHAVVTYGETHSDPDGNNIIFRFRGLA